MCDSCQMLNINGVNCHETGCPAAWKDETRECRECGCDFDPEGRTQVYCNDCLNPPDCFEDEIDEPEEIEAEVVVDDEGPFEPLIGRDDAGDWCWVW